MRSVALPFEQMASPRGEIGARMVTKAIERTGRVNGKAALIVSAAEGVRRSNGKARRFFVGALFRLEISPILGVEIFNRHCAVHQSGADHWFLARCAHVDKKCG